eukprot:scaffold286762_cov47-Prasinocladus_malaysianus.AAC.1
MHIYVAQAEAEEAAGAELELTEEPPAEGEQTEDPTKPAEQQGGAMTAEEKRLARAQRFGMTTTETELAKKKARAERFGIPASEDDRRAERAKRFGGDGGTKDTKALSGGKPSMTGEVQEKLKARAARFGIPTELSEDELKKRKEERAKRFGSGSVDSADFQAKKAARMARFQ